MYESGGGSETYKTNPKTASKQNQDTLTPADTPGGHASLFRREAFYLCLCLGK